MSNDLIPMQDEIKALDMMATAAADSKFFQALNGKAGIFSIMLYARELGLPPMQCIMGGMHNIQGKIELSARLMNSMIRKAGHKIEILECSDTKCVLKGTRKDTGETCTVSFSIEDAKKAGIYKSGGSWDKYGSDMCFARALSRIGRRLWADIIGTAYVEGEIEDDEKPKPVKASKSQDLPLAEAEIEIKEPELCIQVLNQFKSIENLDHTVEDFLIHCSNKSKKTMNETAKSALANADKFSKSYLVWVGDQLRPQDVTDAEVTIL